MTSSALNLPLRAKFRVLEEERERAWKPEALAVNVRQRKTLVDQHNISPPFVKTGDVFPHAVLPTVGGGSIDLDKFVQKKGGVIIFFRFSTCPACNIALPHYRDTLWPLLLAAGIPLVAISPQPVQALSEIVVKHALPFTVASDTGLALSRKLGITYTFDDASRSAAISGGGKSSSLNGLDNVWELPKPAILAVGADHIIHFVDVSPDWMDRTETEQVLAALGL